MASSDRSETAKRPPQCTSLSYDHYNLSSEYHKKWRFCVENRSGGHTHIHVPVHPDSRKYLLFPYEGKPNQSKHSIYSPGLYCSKYLHHQEILVLPYLDDWLVYHPGTCLYIILTHAYKLSSQSVLLYQQVSKLGRMHLRPITTTLSFGVSDKPVYITVSIRQVGP